MGKVIKSILGGSPKPQPVYTPPPPPEPEKSSVEDLEGDKRKNAASRAALAETAGGAAGEELLAGEAKRRQTLFGN